MTGRPLNDGLVGAQICRSASVANSLRLLIVRRRETAMQFAATHSGGPERQGRLLPAGPGRGPADLNQQAQAVGLFLTGALLQI